MRLLRPYISFETRAEVALVQARLRGFSVDQDFAKLPASKRLTALLRYLFGDNVAVHLDHDPALQNRTKVFRNGNLVGYVPAANDPTHLVWRTKPDHRTKTFVRGDHGQYCDVILAARERNRAKKKTKHKYRWPTGRKIQSRPFPSRVR